MNLVFQLELGQHSQYSDQAVTPVPILLLNGYWGFFYGCKVVGGMRLTTPTRGCSHGMCGENCLVL